MAFQLDARSLQRLQGVHPDLAKVIHRAAALSPIEFRVIEGLRTEKRQRELVASGASKTMNSRHLTGHAVDLAPTLDGDVRWDWPLFYPMAAAMQDAVNALGVAIVWGGTWPKFKDGPHFELTRDAYPATAHAA